jgi:outer membrane biogenesis lipoprotein LolB
LGLFVSGFFISTAVLSAAPWEGSDDFSSATVTENLWGTYNQKIPSLYTYVANGRLGVIHNSKVHAVYRVW